MKDEGLHKPIFVLCYHPWLEGFQKYFSRHISWLKSHGFETISLESLLAHLKKEDVSIPERPIVITFDDGTIENFTIVYPLLKEYCYSGTVFAMTAKKYTALSGTHWWRQVEDDGVLIIEGHSHTHAFVYINDHIDNFYTGKEIQGIPYIKGLDERLGSPVFGLGHELVSKRFIPRKELIDLCADYVNRKGGEAFFKKDGWKEELLRVVSTYEGDQGQYETDEERAKRIVEELDLSKKTIEKNLGDGKEVKFFAYPFGVYDSDLIQQLKKSGYVGALTCDPGGNYIGGDPFLVKRMMMLEENSFGGLSEIFKAYF